MMNPQQDPNRGTPMPGTTTRFKLDRKALAVAGVAMGTTLVLWILQGALETMFGGAGWIIMLLMVAGGGGYVFYRGHNPEQARALEARVQQLTHNAAGRLSGASVAGMAPPPANHPVGGTADLPSSAAARFPGAAAPPQSGVTAAFVSAALLIPSLIAYAAMYESTGFTSQWQPWWILTGLHVFFILCVASRARAASRRPLAILLGLIGTGLIGLANNPSGDVNLMTMLSSKRYYDGVSYPVPPSPDVMMWIMRTPTLAVVLFVAAWGIARRRQSAWVFGLIPTGLLVWWSIYGFEHGFAVKGGWFSYWLMSVGVFAGGCICCWLADLFASAGGMTAAVPPSTLPTWAGPVGPPPTSAGPVTGGPATAHAGYRQQATRHFQQGPHTYGPPGSQGGPH